MFNFTDEKNARKNQVINVVRRSLSYIDKRLIDHGERVAYIAAEIAKASGGLGLDPEKLLILSLLHDIGAYKTEEIDQMVRFETSDAMAHAIYGYVFLKNTTPLGEYAQAILYHHTDYSEMRQIDSPYALYAELIYLADRIDILLLSPPVDWQALRALAGSAFSPDLMDLFFTADQERNISGRVLDSSYKELIDERIYGLNLTEAEIDSFLNMLVYSIDFRSPFTVTHTANTTSISATIAALLGLSAEQRSSVILGAFLHDIGKIVIPNSILENPGKLDPPQMARMRTHVTASEEILSGIVPDEVRDIAVRHHEKLNGAGYPRGLPGEELTTPQRIVAVADILSALINRRSYKEPFPKEKCIAILEDMRDKGELCPLVCDAAIGNYDFIVNVACQDDDPVIHMYETIKSQYAEYSQRAAKKDSRRLRSSSRL